METKEEKLKEKETETKKSLMDEMNEEAKKQNSPKKTNRTWEAFGRSKGCFIINDPKFLL